MLVDAGPLVALFDPKDRHHRASRMIFERLGEDLLTTVPVVTEVSHILGPTTPGFHRIMDLFASGRLQIDYLSDAALARACELMKQYSDQSMDLADASLAAVAEERGTTRIWTFDERDFSVFRIRRGHGFAAFEIVR